MCHTELFQTILFLRLRLLWKTSWLCLISMVCAISEFIHIWLNILFTQTEYQSLGQRTLFKHTCSTPNSRLRTRRKLMVLVQLPMLSLKVKTLLTTKLDAHLNIPRKDVHYFPKVSVLHKKASFLTGKWTRISWINCQNGFNSNSFFLRRNISCCGGSVVERSPIKQEVVGSIPDCVIKRHYKNGTRCFLA